MITKLTTFSPFVLVLVLALPSLSVGQGSEERPKSATSQAVELLMRARQFAKDVEDREQHDVLMGDIAQDLAKMGETTGARETFALIIDDKWRDYSLKPFLESQLQTKQFVDAQQTVDAMKTTQGKAEALCTLASAQWESGSRVTAKKTLRTAEQIYAQRPGELTNAIFLEQLALTEDELGESAKASHTKRELAKVSGGEGIAVDSWDMSWLHSESGKLREAGRAEAKNGDLAAARSSLQRAANEIESVPHAGDRAILLYMIASDQANAGDKEGARNTFLQAVDKAAGLSGTNRDLILRDVVEEQAAAGFIDDSLQAVTNIADAHLKWQALHRIAVAQTEHIGLESGLKTAGQIQSESEYDVTLVDIAQFLGKQVEIPEVYRVVTLIHSNYMKSLALLYAAESLTGG